MCWITSPARTRCRKIFWETGVFVGLLIFVAMGNSQYGFAECPHPPRVKVFSREGKRRRTIDGLAYKIETVYGW